MFAILTESGVREGLLVLNKGVLLVSYMTLAALVYLYFAIHKLKREVADLRSRLPEKGTVSTP